MSQQTHTNTTTTRNPALAPATVHPTTAWRRFNSKVTQINDANPKRQQLKSRIRGGCKHTAVVIFQDYLKAKRLDRTHPSGWFETSTSLIGTRTGFPTRTVYDHIGRLTEIGYIIGKVQIIENWPPPFGNNYFLRISDAFFAPRKSDRIPP